ncbi:hypothetical protein ATE47_09865 [Chryseobacterium sp. IHB B 17019]|uniref:hypothetical protein n=1 Tax=Chryseobacterium sp. IHB B 17019 TaxID=1721091 RepID=UPI00071F5FC4|nr:hypothetical protein [Chryseobacterium sp. IHB B 17019]ALR30813.1 hypothetical protein ATE47_09865 [Chryseobacterium sp. IHB B 17019]
MMKTIISKIIEESDLKTISVNANVDFTYYDDGKDDFFLFLFYNQNELIELNNNEVVDLEYTINRIIVDLKNNENISKFKERNIDHNLSLILLLELEEDDNIELRRELNKVEENSLNAKKYVFPYFKNDIENLLQKIDEKSNVVNLLNEIAVDNSNLLDKVDERWYKTLMGFFIKIPFLNYQSTEDNQSLENLSLTIEESLSYREKQLLSVISENNFDSFSNIEDFITQFNLTIETNDEI